MEDDFAYVASMDLSQIEESFNQVEQRMNTFTQNVLKNLETIEAAFKKAFNPNNMRFPDPPKATGSSGSPPIDSALQVIDGGGSGMVPGGGDFGAGGAEKAANSYRSLQRSLIDLIATQLEQTNVNDGTTLAFIRSSAATSTTVSEFKQLVTQATTLTSKEFEVAKSIALTQSKVLDLVDAAQQGKVSQQEFAEAAENLTVRFRELNKLQESRTSKETTTVNEEMAQSWRNLGDTIARVAQIQQQKGSAEFQKVLRQFPEIRKSVQGLVSEYGAFSSKIIQTGTNASEQQRRFQQLLGTNKQLAQEVDRLTKEYGEFTVALNTATVGTQKQSSGLDNLGKKIGLTAGITSALTQELIQMGRQGVQAFQDIIESSVQVSQEFQSARISFAAIFEGNKEVAADVFNFVRDESRRLGIDLAQIATSFLPQVESLDQLSKIAEISVELLRLPAAIASGKSQTDAVIAISEFLAGQTRSLQTRFNITIEDTQRLKRALEEGGIDEFLTTFDELLSKLGINFEDFAETTPFLVNKVKQSVIDLQDTLGTPIDAELNRFFSFLAEFLSENEVELERFAEGLGEIIASIGGFVGDKIIEFLEDFDFDAAIESLDEFQLRLESTFSLINKIIDVLEVLDSIGGKDIKPGTGEFVFTEFEDSLKDTVGFNLKTLANPIESIKALLGLLGDLVVTLDRINVEWGKFLDPVPFRAFAEGIQEVVPAFETAATSLEDLFSGIFEGTTNLSKAPAELVNTLKGFGIDVLKEFGITFDEVMTEASDSTDETTESVLDLGDAILAAQRAAEKEIELNLAKEETQAIIDEINDDIVKANEDVNRRIFEAQLALERKRIETLIKFSRDRAKIEQDYLDKLEDIDKKFLQKRDDIFVDFARDQEDASRDAGRAQVEIDKELAKEKIKIEEDLQRELARIQRQFEFDAQEAIRNNDAIAFLQLRRKLAFELDEARRKRDEDVQDAETSADDEKTKVNDKLREQMEDARIQRDRGVQDAQIAAQRERENALTERTRSIAEQTLKEKQFTEDLMLERQQRIEDLERYAAEKQAALVDSLKDEFEAVKTGQERIAELEQEIYELRLKQMREYYATAIEEAQSFDQKFFNQNSDIQEAESFDKGKTSGASGGTGVGGNTGTIGQLKALAKQLAQQYNLVTQELIDYINTATRDQLNDLIDDMRDNQQIDNPIPRAQGGSVTSGNRYLVGENSAEILDMRNGFPGRITPLNQTGFHLPGPSSHNVSINNSRTANVDLSLLDLSSFSPSQIAQVQEIVNQLFLRALG